MTKQIPATASPTGPMTYVPTRLRSAYGNPGQRALFAASIEYQPVSVAASMLSAQQLHARARRRTPAAPGE